MRKLIYILITFTASTSHAESKDSFDKIIREYTFVGDFNLKDYEPKVSDEIFWRYPLSASKIDFPIFFNFDNIDKDIPTTNGEGRMYEHINRGRLAFLSGDYEEAKKIWLSGRRVYMDKFPHLRRLEYFIAMTFMKLAEERLKVKGTDYNDNVVKQYLQNAATFLSWVLINKKSQKDEVVEPIIPKQFYNLAAIYFKYDRFSPAFGTADEGLNYLIATGRKEYRPFLRRIQGESFIKARSYLEAVQEFDTAIRQDPNPEQAAAMFSRVGDIYFDLNNYVLAEDAYELSERVDKQRSYFNARQALFRGEALFWMGKFEASQKHLQHAIDGALFHKQELPRVDESFAKLRIADAYFALSSAAKKDSERKALNEKAQLAYFQVEKNYQGTLAAKIAQVRAACLELPFYEGKNIAHGRETLEAAKESTDFPKPIREIAWSCHVGSFAQRERTDAMLERVRDFANEYPDSKFLQSLVGPVRETQANKIYPIFATDRYKALEFFEKNRKNLFPKITPDLALRLFNAYVDAFKSEKAVEFYTGKAKSMDEERQILRQAAFLSEVDDKNGKKWHAANVQIAKKIVNRKWTSKSGEPLFSYIWRIQQTKSGKIHDPWIYQATMQWSGKTRQDACDLAYPLLSKLHTNPLPWVKKGMVGEDLQVLIKKHFPQILDDDPSCAQSLLDLEAKIYAKRLDDLTALYTNRASWMTSSMVVSQAYVLAETQFERGQQQLAEALWKMVVQSGNKFSPEVTFAKARLDPKKTELEEIWQ